MSVNTHTTSPDVIPWLTYRTFLLGSLQLLAVLCMLAQVAIDPSTDNLVCSALVLASSTLMLQYLWRSEAMTTHPLSSLALLGFTASSQLVAFISQTAELAPFIQYLRAPQLTFTVLAVAHVTAVAAHFAYRHFEPLGGSATFLAEKVLAPLNIHRVPTPEAIWMLGMVGFAGMLLGAGGGVSGDVGGKFLHGLSFLAWLPFMLPLFRDLQGDGYVQLKKHLPFLVLWALMIAALALAKNHRATMLVGPIQLALVFLVYKCRGHQPVSRSLLKRLPVAMVLMALLMPHISDLLLSMQLARDKRGTISKYEQMVETFEVFQDKNRLAISRELAVDTLSTNLYDETYLSNTALTRFTETKFHDNMLYFGQQLTEVDKQDLVQQQLDRAVALLPQNVLDMLDIKLDKLGAMSYSNGDYYIHRAIGAPLGSLVTGSMWADLYVLAGLWMPFAAAIMFWLVFIALDCLSRFGPGQFISPMALCTVYMIYINGLTGESIFTKFAFVTRGTLQPILLYAAFFAVTAFLLQLFRKSAWVSAVPSASGEESQGEPASTFTIHR